MLNSNTCAMNSKWIASKKSSLIQVIMAAALGMAGFSCTEPMLGDPQIEHPTNGDFWVGQEGKVVYALEGRVILEFPEEAVSEPTLFTIASFPLDNLEMDGYNMMNCGVSLTCDVPGLKFGKSVHLKLTYCSSDFKAGSPVIEEDITIYGIIPDVHAFSIGDCCVDCIWDIISGCIDECGIYVVGVK
jgi:hypothetical protein